MLISNTAEFKDKLLGTLFPKKESQAANIPTTMNVFMLGYVPSGGIRSLYPGNALDSTTDLINFTKKQLIPAMNNGSKFHGYSNPNASAALNYVLSDNNIRFENNPPPHTGPNLSDPFDYAGVFTKYNLCKYAKSNDIKMIIIWVSGHGPYWAGQMGESAITGNKGIPTNGPSLPLCDDKTIVVMGLNFTRDLGSALHSYGHHLESIFRFFKPLQFEVWSDEYVAAGSFWGKGDSCGTVHNPPNARNEYDWVNMANFSSDCRNWKLDGTGVKEALNCSSWGCNEVGWMVFRMQNTPNGWWPYVQNPDGNYGTLNTPSTPGLVYYLKLDEVSGDSLVESRGSNTGTSIGTNSVVGKIGQSRNFNGASYIDSNVNLASILGGTASISFWIKTGISGSSIFWQAPGITGVESGSTNDVRYGWIDEVGKIHVDAGNGATAASANPINDNSWHHVVLTRNSVTGIVQIYVDNSAPVSATSESGNKTTPISTLGRIVGSVGASRGYFIGALDEIGIWNKVLTASEVSALYNGGNGLSYSGLSIFPPVPTPSL